MLPSLTLSVCSYCCLPPAQLRVVLTSAHHAVQGAPGQIANEAKDDQMSDDDSAVLATDVSDHVGHMAADLAADLLQLAEVHPTAELDSIALPHQPPTVTAPHALAAAKQSGEQQDVQGPDALILGHDALSGGQEPAMDVASDELHMGADSSSVSAPHQLLALRTPCCNKQCCRAARSAEHRVGHGSGGANGDM